MYESLFIFWNPNAHRDAIRKWDLYKWSGDESGAFMNKISALIKETLERPLILSTMWVYNKKLGPGRGSYLAMLASWLQTSSPEP